MNPNTTHRIYLGALIAACFVATSCSTLSGLASPENTRFASSLVCGQVIASAAGGDQRKEARDYIWSVIAAVKSVTGPTTAPEPLEVQAAIARFTPAGERWSALGAAIARAYARVYPQIKGNTKQALVYLNAVAAGCEDGAAR